jgi:SAM-dependent methyltransferase
MERPDWAPESIDIERPSIARMYDYYLGGSHNFAVDRDAARQVIAAVPEAPLMAQANRAFLRRVVRFLIDSGVRQFLDIGSGIPTVGNVHEIAQEIAPGARVVYADLDPVAVAHSEELLVGNERAMVIQEDLRRPKRILDHPEVRALLDFDQPIAVMIIAVMHFVPDSSQPARILATIRDALAPGSYVALSQASTDGRENDPAPALTVYQKVDHPITPRSRAEVTRLLSGLDLVEPGVVWVPEWRPDSIDLVEDADRSVFLCGVGQLR